MTQQDKVSQDILEILRQVRDDGFMLERFDPTIYPPKNPYIDQILTLIKDAGYVQLDDDQSLPFLNDIYNNFNSQSPEVKTTVNRMLKAGWKKVKQ